MPHQAPRNSDTPSLLTYFVEHKIHQESSRMRDLTLNSKRLALNALNAFKNTPDVMVVQGYLTGVEHDSITGGG